MQAELDRNYKDYDSFERGSDSYYSDRELSDFENDGDFDDEREVEPEIIAVYNINEAPSLTTLYKDKYIAADGFIAANIVNENFKLSNCIKVNMTWQTLFQNGDSGIRSCSYILQTDQYENFGYTNFGCDRAIEHNLIHSSIIAIS